MTGTCSMNVQQIKALAKLADGERVVRLIVTPQIKGLVRDLRVEVRTLDSGDVLTGTRYVLDSGRVLTTQEYEKLTS